MRLVCIKVVKTKLLMDIISRLLLQQKYIRQGLVQGILPIGTAFKREGSKHYDYYISPKLFYEFTGYKIDNCQ